MSQKMYEGSQFKERMFHNFLNKQEELEKSRRLRIVQQAQRRSVKEMEKLKPYKTSSKSRRLASSLERTGNVYERLFENTHDDKKILGQAKEVLNNLNNKQPKLRPNSHSRKGIKLLNSEEKKDCTFQPNVHQKPRKSSKDNKVVDRLLQDAYKRKDRKDYMKKQELAKIRKGQVIRNSEKSMTLAYKVFSKDFRKAIEK